MSDDCICGRPGLTYAGPLEDCPEHGRDPNSVPCWSCGGNGGRYDRNDAWLPCRICDETGEVQS